MTPSPRERDKENNEEMRGEKDNAEVGDYVG
jgi:hypothetical protein